MHRGLLHIPICVVYKKVFLKNDAISEVILYNSRAIIILKYKKNDTEASESLVKCMSYKGDT